MRFVRFTGELVEAVGDARMTDRQLRRTRAMHMYVMRKAGRTNAEIAAYFRLSVRRVQQELNGMPAWAREKADALVG